MTSQSNVAASEADVNASGTESGGVTGTDEEPPEGYYAFIESPSAVPPKVRPPPYTHVKLDCKELHSKKSFVSVHNLCGDLNKGQIPRNPMQQNVLNEPYPLYVLYCSLFILGCTLH